MDDLDLDKIDLDSFNTDESLSNTSQSSNQGNDSTANRPRLRKIKRPKQHSGPISTFPQSSSKNANTGTSKQTASTSSSTSTTPKSEGGLIRASDRNNYTTDYNNYPSPGYAESYTEPAEEEEFVYQGNDYGLIARLDNKKLMMLLAACLVLGLLLGKFMFSTEQVVRNGLQGVIVNPEVPKGRSRCGVAEKTQGCVLYVMNPQRQELNGRDFYDLAAQLTGRQRFVIETGNMRYSSVKIKPGNIAQLNIPPLQ